MILDEISTWELAAMIVAFIVSGLVRGFNGGAGANFITAPVVALIIGPREGVPIIILLNLISNIQVMPGALPHTDWRRMLPVGIAAMATAPLGAWILLAVDEDTMRRIVAATSIVLALLLLTGWRYRGPRGLPIRIGVGGLGGMITGAVTMGGPPLAGPTTRAQTGVAESVRPPSPIGPCPFHPAAYTSPATVANTECSAPAATERTGGSDGTRVGAARSAVSPKSLGRQPHARRRPHERTRE